MSTQKQPITVIRRYGSPAGLLIAELRKRATLALTGPQLVEAIQDTRKLTPKEADKLLNEFQVAHPCCLPAFTSVKSPRGQDAKDKQ